METLEEKIFEIEYKARLDKITNATDFGFHMFRYIFVLGFSGLVSISIATEFGFPYLLGFGLIYSFTFMFVGYILCHGLIVAFICEMELIQMEDQLSRNQKSKSEYIVGKKKADVIDFHHNFCQPPKDRRSKFWMAGRTSKYVDPELLLYERWVYTTYYVSIFFTVSIAVTSYIWLHILAYKFSDRSHYLFLNNPIFDGTDVFFALSGALFFSYLFYSVNRYFINIQYNANSTELKEFINDLANKKHLVIQRRHAQDEPKKRGIK